MSSKQAKVYYKLLFNKNHIKIEQTDYINNSDIPSQDKYITYNTLTSYRQEQITEEKPKIYKIGGKKYIKKISSLGFWYYQEYNSYHNNDLSRKLLTDITHEIKFYAGKRMYTITYLYQYGNNVVSFEQRPWDIAPDGSMADHLVNDLLKIINEIFIYAEVNKLKLRTKKTIYGSYKTEYNYSDLSDFKKKIYTELFGAPNGPIYQTDKEKILSHGFDTKISFRKRKDE